MLRSIASARVADAVASIFLWTKMCTKPVTFQTTPCVRILRANEASFQSTDLSDNNKCWCSRWSVNFLWTRTTTKPPVLHFTSSELFWVWGASWEGLDTFSTVNRFFFSFSLQTLELSASYSTFTPALESRWSRLFLCTPAFTVDPPFSHQMNLDDSAQLRLLRAYLLVRLTPVETLFFYRYF